VAGELVTNPNRAPRTLGDVLRRFTQAQGCRRRGTPDLSKGRTTQVCLADLLEVSNKEAEYEALLHWLRLVIALGIKRLLVYGDSTMVINHVNKSWDRNKENMDTYFLEVRK
jgi:ribonuclease HI